VALFPLLVFSFFWDQTSFIVRSQIGWENRHEIKIFGIATLQKRGKPCPISKKMRKEKGKMDVRSQKNMDVRSQIGQADPPETRETLSDLKKSDKRRDLKKPMMCDLRWKGNIHIKRRYSDARELGDGC